MSSITPSHRPVPERGHAAGAGYSPYRESTMQSADDAEGIFDLYGPSRESYQSAISGVNMGREDDLRGRESPIKPPLMSQHEYDARLHRPERDPVRSEPQGGERDSGSSWEGPMEALRPDANTSHPVEGGPSTPNGHAPRPIPSNGRRSLAPAPTRTGNAWDVTPTPTPPPEITITRDNTPSKRISGASAASAGSSGTSSSNQHSHRPAPMSRLTPRHTLSGDTSLASSTTSQVSVGSSKYPGEEEDAFHVRSTWEWYLDTRLTQDARLEAIGVHGDGWDPGVERTRGGPSGGRRATIVEVDRDADVGASEREYLSNLDRYGFVNEPLRSRETRLALIPVSPLSRLPKLPSRSPLANQPRPPLSMGSHDGSSPPGPPMPRADPTEGPSQRKKENERVGKWMKMMRVSSRDVGGNITGWEWRKESREKVGRRVWKGVPDRWRMAAWWTMAEDRTSAAREKGKGREARKTGEELGLDFRQSIDQPSSFDVQIDLDVPRTISGHTLFVTRYGAGQRSLFHVLHCFSMLCDTCGYVQGMGPIAATLLCYFDPERVYALLVRLHDIYEMHTIFAPGFPGLLEAFYVQERLMEWLMPSVFTSFARNGVSSTAYGTKWYITLFVNTVPFSQQLRLWDALWLEGLDVLIMMAVAILWSYQDLLSAPNANFESILSLLSSFFVAEDEDKLMDWIRRMLEQANVRKRMGEWREEWRALVREGKEGGALL